MTEQATASSPAAGQGDIIEERADLLELLRTRRYFLQSAAKDLTDEQAAARPTVSELCIGGLIKHVAKTEAGWVDFILSGPAALSGDKDWTQWGEAEWAARAAEFQLLPTETLAGVMADYAAVAARTDALVTSLPDLGVWHLLPAAPWFEPGARRSARQAFLHIAAETAQHAGHADIIRESIDGTKSMG